MRHRFGRRRQNLQRRLRLRTLQNRGGILDLAGLLRFVGDECRRDGLHFLRRRFRCLRRLLRRRSALRFGFAGGRLLDALTGRRLLRRLLAATLLVCPLRHDSLLCVWRVMFAARTIRAGIENVVSRRRREYRDIRSTSE